MNASIKVENSARHMSYQNQVNFGSYYTPKKYVDLVKMWMKEFCIDSSYTIMDPSCGYGAFFQLCDDYCYNRFIGNDIDDYAVSKAKEYFPFIETYRYNVFENVEREKYNIKNDEKLIIVGNPPYNDITSQIHQNIKNCQLNMNSDVKTRDYGMTSLLVYNKLRADYVIVLHPLSYLIKKSNFNICKNFFNNYELIEHIIFNSQEFDNTSKKMGFPIIIGMYKRKEKEGLSYNNVLNYKFRTIEGNQFIINNKDYVCKYINKYPNNERYKPEILFYTLRDINALKRSRTFIKQRENNAVDVNPQKMSYYCYIDCFKKFANVPYYMGNFDIPFISSEFDSIKKDVMQISVYEHPEVFGKRTKCPTQDVFDRVVNYINKAILY